MVIGLFDPLTIPEVVVVPSPMTYMPVNMSVPGKVMVVRGGVAYEYTYRNPLYDDSNLVPKVQGGHYVLTNIRNGFGDLVTFTYGTNGVDFTAAWTANGTLGPSVSVTLTSVTTAASPVPNLIYWPDDPTSYYNNLANLKVAYSGVSEVSTYSLSGATFNTTMPTTPACFDLGGVTCTSSQPGFEDFRESFQATSLQVDATGEAITFSYGQAAGVSIPLTSFSGTTYVTTYYTPNTLVSISFPGRNINLDWSYIHYMPNGAKPNQQGFFPPKNTLGACGVSGIHDQDVSSLGLVERLTTHVRVSPSRTIGRGEQSHDFY